MIQTTLIIPLLFITGCYLKTITIVNPAKLFQFFALKRHFLSVFR
jgi:hypothetical protein